MQNDYAYKLFQLENKEFTCGKLFGRRDCQRHEGSHRERSAIAEANQAEDDRSMTTKDLAAADNNLAIVHEDCMTVVSDHETTVAARAEALKVIATAKKILEGITGGAVWVKLCIDDGESCLTPRLSEKG